MFWTKVPSLLDHEYERALRELEICEFGSQEYVKTLNLVQRLSKMRQEEKPHPISKDTLAIVGANLLGIIMIISHEQVGNLVTSRALGFVLKPR